MEDEPTPKLALPEKKRSVVRKLIIFAICIVVLILLLIGGAVAYTYYFGATPTIQTLKEAPKPEVNAVKKPAPIAADAKVGVSTQTITSPVMPGANSFISIQTLAGIPCTIDVEYNKVKSTDSGLVQKTSDEYGVVSWSWTVEPKTPLGTWPVIVACAHGKQSGTVTANLVVSKDGT